MAERKTPKSGPKKKGKKAKDKTPDPSRPWPNPRYERFAQLCIDPEKTQHDAFIEVYPHASKWKAESVDQRASRLAVKVQSRIEWLQAQLAKAQVGTLAEADEILWEMLTTTYADHMFVLPDGEAVIALTPDTPKKYAIHSLKQRIEVSKAEEGGEQSIARIVEYKLHDRKGLLDLFYKRRGAFPPTKVALEADDNFAKILAGVRKSNKVLDLKDD